MASQVIIEGNFDPSIHVTKDWCDAFGNKIEPPEGYYLLRNDKDVNDIIQKGDLHFDIYGGWTDGHSEWYNGNYVDSAGRWRAWARKIETK